jgi:ABC-type transporter Mla subunit MlaD
MWNRKPDRLERKVDFIVRLLWVVIQQQEELMSAVDNLKAAVAQVLQDVADETAELGAAIQKVSDLVANGASAADVQDAADQLNAVHQNVVDAIAAAQAVLDPQPAPPSA